MSSADALAIANAKAAYCAAADRAAGDPDAARVSLLDLLLPEATADYGAGTISGAMGIADFLCTAIAGNSAWMLHMLHSPRIEPAGDAAQGNWTVMVHACRRGGGQIDQIIGRYETRFARAAAGWRIAHVRFARLG